MDSTQNQNKHVGKYSMGMCQRLGIAQAIMESPDLILLDEAMNGLDEQGVEDMRLLFRNLKEQGKTIVLATHVKEDVELLCDRIYRSAHEPDQLRHADPDESDDAVHGVCHDYHIQSFHGEDRGD